MAYRQLPYLDLDVFHTNMLTCFGFGCDYIQICVKHSKWIDHTRLAGVDGGRRFSFRAAF
jgi:hypothetical protein